MKIKCLVVCSAIAVCVPLLVSECVEGQAVKVAIQPAVKIAPAVQTVPAIQMTPAKTAVQTTAAVKTAAASQQVKNDSAKTATAATANGAAAVAKGAEAAKESREQKMVKLLLAAKFDRTTPSVLKAWSQRPDDKKAKPQKKVEPNYGVVKNAFEGFAVFEFEKAPQVQSWRFGESTFRQR